MSARRKKIEPKPLPVEGYPRPYIRDGVPGLSLERQEEMLSSLGLDMSDDAKIYVDRFSRKRVNSRPHLKQRDQAISPPHPWQIGETIYIAGLRVLGWDNLEVMRSATTAFNKGCRIYCVDTGSLYSADTPAAEMIDALTKAEEARRRARTGPATEGQLGRRARRVQRGLEIARPLWDGEMSGTDIAKLSRLSVRTLYAKLGRRFAAKEAKRKANQHA